MRQWQGLRGDQSDVGEEGLFTAQNMSIKVSGEARRRPGLAWPRVDNGGTLITEWTDPFNTVFLVLNEGTGSLSAINQTSLVDTTISTGLSTARGCFARSNGRLYFVNDFNTTRRIESGSATAGTAGIVAPEGTIGSGTISTTGSITVGTHGLRYRYYDSKSLYLSDPSGQKDLAFTSTGSAGMTGSTLTLTIGTGSHDIVRSQDSKVDQVIVEMTDAGSSTFYRAATVNQVLTATVLTIGDVDLRNQVSAKRDGDFNHQPPPLCSMMAEHRGRLFGWGSTVLTITGVTVSSSSANLTVTGTTFSSGWAGRLVRVDTDTKNYRVAAMSGTALANLSETYTGTSRTSTGVTFFSATPDMLYWSRAGFPESWNTINFARRVLQGCADTPSALYSHHEVLYLFGQRTIRMLDYASDPASGQLVSVPGEMGVWNQRCVVEANGRLYAWGRSGAFTINGLIPQHLSRRVDRLIDGTDSSSSDNYDLAQTEEFHGVYDPRERAISWFYCTSSETGPQHAIRYDIDSNEWFIDTYKHVILSSTVTTGGSSANTRALVCDNNTFSWYLAENRFDAVPTNLTSGGVVTVSNTGSTTTIINITESLPTGTGGNLGGVIAIYSGQQSTIASNTASTITLASALSAAPTIGTELFLGQIDFAVRTKWLTGSGMNTKKRPSYLAVEKYPGTSAGKLTIQLYLDFATNPFTWTSGASDQFNDGVNITNNGTSLTIDLDGGSGDGVTFIPLPANWHRAIAVKVSNTRPQNTLRILDLYFVNKDKQSIVDVEDE